MRRFFATLVVVTLVGLFAVPAFATGRAEATAICHRSRPSDPAWRLLFVAPSSMEAHRAHGDGAPGGPVPGAAGWTFDSACTPQPAEETGTTTTTIPGTIAHCFDGSFESYDLYVDALNVDDGASYLSSTDGTCVGARLLKGTIVDGTLSQATAAAECAAILGGDPAGYVPLRLQVVYPDVPADWWFCP